MSRLFLGVDGGGSHSQVCVTDQNGKVLSQTTGASTNLNLLGIDQVSTNLSDLITKSLQGLEFDQIFSCLALAGVNFAQDLKAWQQIIAKDSQLNSLFTNFPLITNDTKAALRAGTDSKNGVVIVSGTGSNCYGVNESGKEVFCGGEDYILADQGSGYSIGLEILKSVTKYLDGRGDKTILTLLLFKKYKIKSLPSLHRLVYNKPWNKADIAAVEETLEEAVKEDDPKALQILDTAVGELIQMVKVVVEKLNLKDKGFDLVTSGSVLIENQILNQKFIEKVSALYPKVKILRPKINQAQAAALIAQEQSLPI